MLCKRENCTGCFACFNVCPKNAIYMKEDIYGYIYPEIDTKKCIECHLCEKICPVLNKVNFKNYQKCFAGFSKNTRIRNNSSSGGIATVFSEKILKSGGIVYGASFKDNCEVEHIRITNIEDLHKLQGSKYVHSYIKDSFKKAKKDLENKKKVLFIGTPCQIAGLKNFLNKEYNNLLLIDIICHGVPSQKYLKDEILYINKNLDIDEIRFRKNNIYQLSLVKKGKELINQTIETSPYLDSFIKTLDIRDNCFN